MMRRRAPPPFAPAGSFEPVDAGPLKNARLLEPFAMVWIDQAMRRGRGRDFAFAMVK